MMKTVSLFAALAVILMATPLDQANAGGRHYKSSQGFFIFDLFSQAPDSKYRKPQVRGFKKKVGGYSYKYNDTLDGYGEKPYDFNPIFDRGAFSERLGVDGPYIGN